MLMSEVVLKKNSLSAPFEQKWYVSAVFFFFLLLLKNPLNSFNFFLNVNFSGVELSIVSIIQLYGVFFPSVSDIIYQLWAHGDQ